MCGSPLGVNRIVQGQTICSGGFGKPQVLLSSLAGKSNYRCVGMAGFQRGYNPADWRQRKPLKIIALQRSGPAVEQFHHFGTGVNLFAEIVNRGLGQQIN